MTEPPTSDWDADRLVARAEIIPVKQAVWRGHRRRYGSLDPGGSRLKSGRFHRAIDQFSRDSTWPALYTACELAASLGEIQRSIFHQDDLLTYRFTEIWAQLDRVLDCRDLESLGVRFEYLFDDYDYTLGQEIDRVAVDRACEALLVPSATRLGDNLIVFPHLVRRDSVLVEVRSIDPNLVKRRLST